jgi:AGCS family alanine or glycine:cation symporter
MYILASLLIITIHFKEIPNCISLIFTMAFSDNAIFGGLVGVLVKGVTRAAFSNEAGLGSAAIAHAAAKTNEPVREGIVAMVGPVLDTVIVCTMTALVIIVTGVWQQDISVTDASVQRGVILTAEAFKSTLPGFQYILTIAISLFAYSTMISWCYYGERGWIYLLDHFNGAGLKTVFIYRLTFLGLVYVGAISSFSDVLTFSDLMILSLAFPNIIGSVILARKVWPKVNDYWTRYKAGEMKTYK